MKRLLPILAILLLVLSAESAPAGKGRVDPVKVRREIKQILASPEYNRSHSPGTIEKLYARAGKALRNAVVGFFKWLGDRLSFGDMEGAGLLASLGTWAVVIAFVGLVGLVVWKLVRSAGAHAGPEARAEGADFEMPSAKPLMKQAAKLAEAGDYRAAFRAAYLASIVYLDGIRALRFERSRTNWEYMRELKRGGHDKPHSELQPITLDFDRKIYGRETCARQDYLNAAAVYERLSSEEAK